jgi:hypothetical protein
MRHYNPPNFRHYSTNEIMAEEMDIMNDHIGATTQSGEDQNEWHICGPIHIRAAHGYWHIRDSKYRIANKLP